MPGLESTSTVAARLALPSSTPSSSGWAGWQSAPGVVVSGLRLPPPPAPRSVGSYRPTPPPPSPRQSFTASPAGGAPGAAFGPPGVAGAPVPLIGSGGLTIGGLTLTPAMLLLLGVVAVGGYLVLR